jgi:hypothetical protein
MLNPYRLKGSKRDIRYGAILNLCDIVALTEASVNVLNR